MVKRRCIRVIKVSSSSAVDVITPQYRHIKELAQLKYDAEEKREQNLVGQSSQMQTAFSFMTAAIFMAVPICIEYRGALSLKFFLVSITVIISFLMSSLVLASLAQWRWKTKAFPDISTIKKEVIENPEWEQTLKEYNRIEQWINLVKTVQEEKAKLNGRRVKLIMGSMICFFCSIATVVISFFVAIVTII